MRLLDKYIIREYIRTLLIILLSFSVIFIIVDIFDQLPRLLRNGAHFNQAIIYFLLRLPYLFIMTSALGVLLTGLFLMNTLSRYNESIAIRAAGISITRMVLPLFVFAFLYSILILFVGEFILPKTESYRDYIYNVEIKGKERQDMKVRSNIHYPGKDNYLFAINYFDGYKNEIRNVDISQFDYDTGTVIRKIICSRALWKNDIWVGQDCYVREKNADGVTNTHFKNLELKELDVTPEGFIKKIKDPNSMNFFELYDYIKRLKHIGEIHNKELVDLHFKLAFPFANFIIILFCVPLASASTRSKGRGIVFLIGLLICFLYLSMLRVSQSLGHNGILEPWLAAWLPNMIFLVAGIGFVVKSEI